MLAPKLNIVFCGIAGAAIGELKLKPPLLGSLFCTLVAGLPKANRPLAAFAWLAFTCAGFGEPKALLLTAGEPKADVAAAPPKTAFEELPKSPVVAGAGVTALLLAPKDSFELNVIAVDFFSSCF